MSETDANGDEGRASPKPPITVLEAARIWMSVGAPDPDFADELERISADDLPPEDPRVA